MIDELEQQIRNKNPQRPGEKLQVYQRRISDLVVAKRRQIDRDKKAEQKSESASRGGKKARANPHSQMGVRPVPHVEEDPATILFLDNPRMADAGVLTQRRRSKRQSPRE